MRVALISDLHASTVALDAALGDIEKRNVDRIVCLGDIADLGPEPGATVARLRAKGCDCIQGNHDSFREQFPGLMNIIDWCWNRLDAAQRDFLQGLPSQLRVELAPGVTLLCVHGSPSTYDEQLLAETPTSRIDAWGLSQDVRVVVAGHTHVQLVRQYKGRTFVNVGSVGQPFLAAFDGVNPPRVLRRVEYGIVEWSERGLNVELHSLPLPWDAFRASLYTAGFPDPERWLASWEESS